MTPTTQDREELLDERAIVERFRISPRSIDRLLKAGIFPQPVRVGRRLRRWRLSDLMRWIAELPADVGGFQ